MNTQRVKTLVMWVAPSNDSPAYDIRKKLRRDCFKEYRERNYKDDSGEDAFGKPRKVEIPYTDLHHLVEQLLGEGSEYDFRRCE